MNASGQITTYAYIPSNELTLLTPPAGSPTTSTYDGNGNVLVENTGGALATYTWDGENRLLSFASVPVMETYAYSADGMRQKRVSGPTVTYFVHDGNNVLIETDASLVTEAKYTDLPGAWGGKFSLRRSGQSSFYVPD